MQLHSMSYIVDNFEVYIDCKLVDIVVHSENILIVVVVAVAAAAVFGIVVAVDIYSDMDSF